MSLDRLRPLNSSDLEMVLAWRNDEKVRRWMINQDIIPLSDHLDWYRSNKHKTDRFFLIYEHDSIPEGYVSFTPIKHSLAYEWGFYIRPSGRKGLGQLLGYAALEYGFNTLNISKIFGQVLSFNEKSIDFHRKLGFMQEGLLRDHFSDIRGVFDIYQFGLLKTDWDASKNDLRNYY